MYGYPTYSIQICGEYKGVLGFIDWNQLLEKVLIEFYKYASKTLIIQKFTYKELFSGLDRSSFSDIMFYNDSIYFESRIYNIIEENDHIRYSNILKHVYNYSHLLKKELHERYYKFNYSDLNKELIEKVNHPSRLINFLDNGGSIDDFEYIYG